jgi:hypothetical protein
MAENMIKFLRGNVASLPATATAGAVYFTKDEGLYLGLEDGTYHRYGDFITVANVDALPAEGAHETCMYYCEAENILAKWDGTKWIQINKQKTLAELGGVAKSVYEAKVALLEAADKANSDALTELTTYVGAIPESATAKDVISYIDEKTTGIATDTALAELQEDLDNAEAAIKNLQEANAEGGAVAKAIADAQKAAEEAQATADSKATLDEVKALGYQTAEQVQAIADGKDASIKEAKDRADAAYTLAEGKATMADVNAAIAGAGHAVKSEVDATIAAMDEAYKAADTALETKLQGKIDEKVAQSAYDEKIGALEGADATLQGNIEAEAKTRKEADDAQVLRIAALEGQITGLTGAMHFKGVENAIPEGEEALADYVDGDVILVGEKEYVFNEGTFVEFGDVSAEGERIAVLEGLVGKEAEGEEDAEGYKPATGLVKGVADNAAAIAAEKERAMAKEADLVAADEALAGRLEAVEAHFGENEAPVAELIEDAKAEVLGELATAIAGAKEDAANKDAVVLAETQKGIAAVQTSLDGHVSDTVAHITAAERTAWSAAEGNAKSYADGLKATVDAAYAAADTALETSLKSYADQAEADAKAYADGLKTAIDAAYAAADVALKNELQGYADTAEADAVATAKAYSESLLVWGSF